MHRALPEDIREDEKAVSRITLAIVSEDATFDRIKSTTSRELEAVQGDQDDETESGVTGKGSALSYRVPARPALDHPNTFEYGYRSFLLENPEKALAPVRSLHSLKSFLYPFGGRSDALGLGIEVTYLTVLDESYLGPLGLSGRLKLTTWRGFDIDTFAAINMYTIAADEFKNSPLARDTGTIGIAMRKSEKWFHLENQLYLTGGSEAKQKLGNIEYTHKYGTITAARVNGAFHLPVTNATRFEFGGLGEILLANPYKVSGGAFSLESDRVRVVSAGPEIALSSGQFRVSANARYVIDSTRDTSLDQLGDLMGQGMGQGSFGGAMTWAF